ncbi:MAG: hypothetical protein R3B95_05830 [Nitrospirales bacterium]|nr:hypothetical protein [Nitrospira sp.]MDR4482749.1 hypothetical protein [Nitrospirales bacterium]
MSFHLQRGVSGIVRDGLHTLATVKPCLSRHNLVREPIRHSEHITMDAFITIPTLGAPQLRLQPARGSLPAFVLRYSRDWASSSSQLRVDRGNVIHNQKHFRPGLEAEKKG